MPIPPEPRQHESSEALPDLAAVDAVDTETGEIRRTAALVPKEHQTFIVSQARKPVYPRGAYSLATDRLFEQLATTPRIGLQHLRLMMWFLANADYSNEVKVSLRALETRGIVSNRSRARTLLADLDSWDFVRTVKSPPNSSRTLMINPALRWRGKRDTQRAAVDIWNSAAI